MKLYSTGSSIFCFAFATSSESSGSAYGLAELPDSSSCPKLEAICSKASDVDVGFVALPSAKIGISQCFVVREHRALTKVCDNIPLRQNSLRRERLVDREAVTACFLPSCLSCPTSHDLEQRTSGILVGFASKIANHRGDEVGLSGISLLNCQLRWKKYLECVNHFLWPKSKYKPASLAFGTKKSNQIVIVIAVPADGAIALALMLYFAPSMPSARVKPMIAAFAVEYCNNGECEARTF